MWIVNEDGEVKFWFLLLLECPVNFSRKKRGKGKGRKNK